MQDINSPGLEDGWMVTRDHTPGWTLGRHYWPEQYIMESVVVEV